MKNKIFPLIALLGFALVFALPAVAQKAPKTELKSKKKLEIQQTGGTNGSAVAWHPEFKRYYTVIAGNANFPFEAFKKNGKPAGGDEAGFDFRGLWYNSKSGKLEGNGQGSYGYCEVALSQDGEPMGEIKVTVADMNQPNEQASGDFDPTTGFLVFAFGGTLYYYDAETGDQVESLPLSMNNPEDYNLTSVGATGMENFEYALLNTAEEEVHFFNRKGKLTAKSTFAGDPVIEDWFRFAYANKMIWLYDVDSRSWTGYKAW